MKQKISMEAKKPRVLTETLIFIRKKDLTEIKRRMRKFGLENFTISVKNALASSWLLTKGGQGEAKCETKDFSGSREAKGFEGNINFYSKKDLTEVKKRMCKCRKFGLHFFYLERNEEKDPHDLQIMGGFPERPSLSNRIT